MNRSEAARLLRVAEGTLERWVRQGLIRSLDRHGHGFDRDELARWARDRGIQVDPHPTLQRGRKEPALLSAIERGAVTAAVEVSSAMGAIQIAIESLSQLAPRLRARLLDEALERERMASTALGQGIAVPHPREPLGDALEQPLISLVLLDTPLDWAAVDGELVHTVALLASPTAGTHLEILSQIGRAVRSAEVVRLLRSRPEKSALIDGLRVLIEEKDA
jgi:PTS system nitrogen regulatory IIA component